MTTADAKQLVLDHLARLNAGDLAGAAALMAEDCVNHAAIPEAQGRAGFERIVAKMRAAFPDAERRVEDVIADGDRVVVRLTMSGTHRGDLAFVHNPLPATGKTVSTEQIHIFRVAANQIVEHWGARDDIGLFRQLGLRVVPA